MGRCDDTLVSGKTHDDHPARPSGITELREEERVATEEEIASRGTNQRRKKLIARFLLTPVATSCTCLIMRFKHHLNRK